VIVRVGGGVANGGAHIKGRGQWRLFAKERSMSAQRLTGFDFFVDGMSRGCGFNAK